MKQNYDLIVKQKCQLLYDCAMQLTIAIVRDSNYILKELVSSKPVLSQKAAVFLQHGYDRSRNLKNKEFCFSMPGPVDFIFNLDSCFCQ